MHYFRSLRFPFESPNWGLNLLFGLLCQLSAMLIPVIGPIVWLGYEFEVVEELHLSRGQRIPDFTFQRFLAYLLRGVWVFLLALVAILPVLALLLGFVILLVVLAAAMADRQIGEVPGILGISGVVALMLFTSFVSQLVVMPMTIHAGLTQDFRLGAAWSFMREFNRRVLWEAVLTRLFMLMMGPLLTLAGAAVFCIGMYPAAIVAMLADIHLHYQLYELYLERGGQPVTLKVEQAVRA